MDKEQILELFRQIMEQQKKIRLMNIYQGVPISYEATILDVDPETIRIKTDKYQTVCLYREKETYIQSDLIASSIKARVIDINFLNTEAVLAEFSALTETIGAREIVRVQPFNQIVGKVIIPSEINDFEGELADLSQDGVGIYMPSQNFNEDLYFKGALVRISFSLPGKYIVDEKRKEFEEYPPEADERYSRFNLRLIPFVQPTRRVRIVASLIINPEIQINGEIVNTRWESALNQYRIGIKIATNDPCRAFVAHFISFRQAEIIREIKEIWSILSVKR